MTPVEVRVAGLVAEGLSNPSIADQMLQSRRTVEYHVSHILTKLGARSRADIELPRTERRQRELTSRPRIPGSACLVSDDGKPFTFGGRQLADLL